MLQLWVVHAFLWSRDIKYCDPNLSNVMYNQDLKCGVLVDYDLSISRQQSGADAGSIPFMAINLLNDEYWNGEIVRLYRHEFEAFLWILPFVFLRYQNRKPQPRTPVDEWMTSDYDTCRQKKSDFWLVWNMNKNGRLCQSDFQDHWALAEELLPWWHDWLSITYRSRIKRGGTPIEVENTVPLFWPLFVKQLKLVVKEGPLSLIYIDTLVDELELEKPFWVPSGTLVTS